MKKILAVIIIIFCAFMTYVFIGGFIESGKSKSGQNQTTNQTSTINISTTYDLAEISKHNTRQDCWLIINNNVYDVSKFLVSHPGGVKTITPYCGKEATNAFGGHSSQADKLLADYYIGKLK